MFQWLFAEYLVEYRIGIYTYHAPAHVVDLRNLDPVLLAKGRCFLSHCAVAGHVEFDGVTGYVSYQLLSELNWTAVASHVPMICSFRLLDSSSSFEHPVNATQPIAATKSKSFFIVVWFSLFAMQRYAFPPPSKFSNELFVNSLCAEFFCKNFCFVCRSYKLYVIKYIHNKIYNITI